MLAKTLMADMKEERTLILPVHWILIASLFKVPNVKIRMIMATSTFAHMTLDSFSLRNHVYTRNQITIVQVISHLNIHGRNSENEMVKRMKS